MSRETNLDFLSALLVGAGAESRLVMLEVFRHAGWRLHQARNRKSALECLESQPVQVAVVSAHVQSWSWKQALRDLQRLRRPPQLVVTSRLADESLWAEVLNFGGYDVLTEPLRADEVERVIASARRHFDPQMLRATRVRGAAAAS